MLHLQLATDPRWVNLAEKSIQDILTDHAYCEQKAASSCISLIQLYPHHEALVEELSPIVTEEWSHFRSVLKELKRRNLTLGRQRKDIYVNELLKHQQKGGNLNDRLLDKLLICALIEARSCERFKLLSEGLEDEYLRKFYRGFMESEAGHYVLFMNLARLYFNQEQVKARWAEWLNIESDIMNKLSLRGDRIH
jgi:tRNA-(ms[2]io[6]A)-hydroxylase